MMSSEDDVIDQADALMRRHRCFVARSADDNSPVEEYAAADDVEIPMLTEVVDAGSLTPENINEILATLQNDIRDELSAWLVETLPAAVANASQHILTELDTKARHTLLPNLLEILKNGTRQKL